MAKQSAFQIFNQKLKEKIGVAEQVTTYPEEPELSTKLETMTNQIKKITREIHKQEKTTSTLLEAGTELSDSLVDGGVSFREDPLRYMLAGSLDKVAEVQRHVDDLRSKLGKQIQSEVYEPLDNVIEVDVKEAKIQKSKFEKARVELDTGISKLNGLGKKAKEEKIKEVELEVEELRKNFSQVGMDTVDKLQDTIALSEAEMLGSLVHYMELYRDFFVNSNRFMVTLIPEIEEYKTYIESQREQLHGSAIAKQIEAAAAAAPPEKKFGTLRLKNLKTSFGIGDKKKVDKGTPASEINFTKPENDPFGKDIETTANKDGSDVPAIVDKAVEYIENKGLQEEGIFRISASKKEVDQLKGEIAQTADETTSSPEVVAEKKPDESSSSSSEEKKKSDKEGKEKDGKKDPVRQRSAGSLMIKKTSQEDLRQARRLERAHTISVGIADPSHPINTEPLPDTPSKKGEKSIEEPHEEGAKKKHHAATSPRFKNFIKKLSFRAEKKDKVEKKEDKGEASGAAEVKLEKDHKKHEKQDKEKKPDHDLKKLEKEKKDEEKRLEKERKELEKKKKKELEAAEKEAKKHEKKDKKKKDESTPPESKSGEDHKKELKKSTKDKDKKEESSSSEALVKYEYKPVDAHMSLNLPAGSVPETVAVVAAPAVEVEHKSGEEKKVEVEVKVETEAKPVEVEHKSVEEKKPEVEVAVEVETKNRSRSSSSSSSSKADKPHEPAVEVHATEVKAETKEPEVHVEVKAEPAHEVHEPAVEVHATEVKTETKVPEVHLETKAEHETPKEGEAKVEIESPKVKAKAEKTGAVSPLALSGEDEDKEKRKREKEEKARKEKEESAKKKAEKEAKKKEKEEKEREEKERKKAEKETKKKPAEKEKPEKEPKKKDKKAEAGANDEESSSSSEEKEKKGKKSPKWLQKLKPKTPRKKDDVEKTSPRDEASGDLVLNRKKKAVVVEPANDLESSINSPRPQLTESTSEKVESAPTSNSASELKLKLESTEKARAENQTNIEKQTRSVLSSVGSKLDELENELNTLDLSISPRASTTIPAEASPRDPETPASREKLGSELQNLEAMLNNIPEQVEVKKEAEAAPVTPVIETSVSVSVSAPEHVDEKPKETKDEHSSSSSS